MTWPKVRRRSLTGRSAFGTLYYSDEQIDDRFHLFTVDSRVFGDGFEEGTTAAWSDTP